MGQLTCPPGTLLCQPSSGLAVTKSWDDRRGVRPEIVGRVPRETRSQLKTEGWLECVAIGNICSLCGAPFAEGDDNCSSGHFIGQCYRKPGNP
jgi:hypothetical protein